MSEKSITLRATLLRIVSRGKQNLRSGVGSGVGAKVGSGVGSSVGSCVAEQTNIVNSCGQKQGKKKIVSDTKSIDRRATLL